MRKETEADDYIAECIARRAIEKHATDETQLTEFEEKLAERELDKMLDALKND